MVNSRILSLLLISGWSFALWGMTYDNRFFPLLDKPVQRHDDVHFFLRVQPFAMFADDSFLNEEDDDDDDENGGSLFDIEGRLHQDMVFESLKSTRSKTFIRPDLTLDMKDLFWSLRGRLDAAGVAMRWYYALSPFWEVGGSWLVMGARSCIEPILRNKKLLLSEGDLRDIKKSHELSTSRTDIHGFLWSNVGVGDLDWYIRLGTLRHYFLRCKTIDAGVKLGVIAPLAERRDVSNPASLPFGGNGHWGTYVDLALDTELKDDLFAGFDMRFIHRFARDQFIRMPLRGSSFKTTTVTDGKEDEEEKTAFRGVPLSFSPIRGQARVQPGFTFVFAPYLGFGSVHGGFGAQVQYTLILHAHDTLHDRRSVQTPAVDLDFFRHQSEWNREYVTISIMYDFARNKEVRGRAPLLSFDVDVPVGFFASKQSFKTLGLSLRIESDLW